jgi:hypothetical protein
MYGNNIFLLCYVHTDTCQGILGEAPKLGRVQQQEVEVFLEAPQGQRHHQMQPQRSCSRRARQPSRNLQMQKREICRLP